MTESMPGDPRSREASDSDASLIARARRAANKWREMHAPLVAAGMDADDARVIPDFLDALADRIAALAASPSEREGASVTVARALFSDGWLAEQMTTPEKLRDHLIEHGRQDALPAPAPSDGVTMMLARIVREDEERVLRSQRAASAHNNTDGVGVDFDYMSSESPAPWYVEAKALLAAAPAPSEPTREGLAYDAVSPNGRAMEWMSPLWDAINSRDWQTEGGRSQAHAPGRIDAVNRVTEAVHRAMRLAVECAAPPVRDAEPDRELATRDYPLAGVETSEKVAGEVLMTVRCPREAFPHDLRIGDRYTIRKVGDYAIARSRGPGGEGANR